MRRVSVRTLALMVELLIAVAAHQYLVMLRPAQPDAVWLAGKGAAIQQTPSGGTADL
jgi:hypothetical protein